MVDGLPGNQGKFCLARQSVVAASVNNPVKLDSCLPILIRLYFQNLIFCKYTSFVKFVQFLFVLSLRSVEKTCFTAAWCPTTQMSLAVVVVRLFRPLVPSSQISWLATPAAHLRASVASLVILPGYSSNTKWSMLRLFVIWFLRLFWVIRIDRSFACFLKQSKSWLNWPSLCKYDFGYHKSYKTWPCNWLRSCDITIHFYMLICFPEKLW